MTHHDPASFNQQQPRCHYFVDECGDLNLFDRRGRSLLGQAGVSQFFMVGLAFVPNPSIVQHTLTRLRSDLLADPYFRGVPSLTPDARKTALAFHAKDDLPEVRREVFKLFPTFGVKITVAIRRKTVLLRDAQALARYGRRKLQTNEVYDTLISRLLRDKLHKADENEIVFAWRGKKHRKAALEQAIQRAKRNFAARWGTFHDKPTHISSGYPSEQPCLQVVDYYLWALQRLYETHEERFFEALRSDYRLIMDLDDKRRKPYGEWYKDDNPLTLNKIIAL